MYQTALARREDDQALIGDFDITPTFTTAPPGLAAGAFPQNREVRAFRWGQPDLLVGATAIATRRQLTDRLAQLSASRDQTLVDATDQMLVLLSAEPGDLVGDFHYCTQPTNIPPSPSPASRALAAVADLERWLAIGQDQVAALAGYAPRSVKNWREGMDPYPATVRRLFDVHALIASLTRAMGTDSARLWLAGGGDAGASRRERLADDVGLRSVVAEAAATLFEVPTVQPIPALDFDEEATPDVSRQPDLFSGPVRRARHRP